MALGKGGVGGSIPPGGTIISLFHKTFRSWCRKGDSVNACGTPRLHAGRYGENTGKMLTRRSIVAAILLIAALTAAHAEVKVIDGDTFDVRVPLSRVDTPGLTSRFARCPRR